MNNLIVSNDSFTVLKQLYAGITLDQPYPDDQLKQLRDAGLVVYEIVGHEYGNIDPSLRVSPIHEIGITEKGKAYVEWREREFDIAERRIQSLEKMSESLRQEVGAADMKIKSLNEMSETLKTQAESAEKEARGAAVRSWIAIVISIVAIAVQLLLPQITAWLTTTVK